VGLEGRITGGTALHRLEKEDGLEEISQLKSDQRKTICKKGAVLKEMLKKD